MSISAEYSYTEKKFGEILYYYILAAREDQIDELGKDLFEGLERFENIQRHSQYKLACKKFVNIKSDVKSIFAFIFVKMINELTELDDKSLYNVMDIKLTETQNHIISRCTIKEKLTSEYIRNNMWKQ